MVNNATYRYEYDLAGRLRRVYGSDGYKQRNLYDAKGNIYNTLYTFENNSYIKKYSNNYVYGNDNRINQVHFNQTAVDLDRTYDTLGRVTQKKYSKWGGTPFFTTTYSFLAGANGDTTGMLSSINNKGETISYTYDNRGNITAINEGSTQKAKYTYDELNQLIREDSVYLNKSVAYTYDVGGNLVAKKEYTYTTGALGTATKTINYTYGDSNWKDKLTAYDGKAITYDTMGNTKTYDGNTFEWTGRQLDKITGNGNTSTYKYNADGIRTEKTVNGVTTKYFIEGNRIVLEKVGNEERAFWYDGDGKAAAFVIYDSTGMHPYYYIRNGQGDVIGLFDANGTIVARYSYDSWGNLLKITDGSGNDKTNDTTFIGYKNPIRYRGYYYDSETKLYYLQSRYYNPEWGRFINADSIVLQDILGANIFAYCYNNPVNKIDPSGKKPGDLFENKLAAARDFGIYINAKSIRENIEYGGSIYEVKKPKASVVFFKTSKGFYFPFVKVVWVTYYTYDEPVKGNDKHTVIPKAPDGHKLVAAIHTHAAYISTACDNISYDDRQVAKGLEAPMYLVNPIGELRIYHQDIDKWFIIFNDLPYDSNHPQKNLQ